MDERFKDLALKKLSNLATKPELLELSELMAQDAGLQAEYEPLARRVELTKALAHCLWIKSPSVRN